jgi:hypothetical protein
MTTLPTKSTTDVYQYTINPLFAAWEKGRTAETSIQYIEDAVVMVRNIEGARLLSPINGRTTDPQITELFLPTEFTSHPI